MAERSFVNEVKLLRSGAGSELHVEGILAVTKALLESGVAYVGGYQGAPISHLMDVLGDAHDILEELDVYFENSASEATAAAMLAASVHYPLRGAVTFKSTVGLNVASDALANLASGGVQGGALVILGEDYGEGSSIMQERSHAFAMKSQMWLLDPRPNITAIVNTVKHGFALSEASNTPVMLDLRLRSCHLQGSFVAEDNVRPPMTITDAVEHPQRDLSRIVLPPASFLHEHEKVHARWPAAVEYIREHGLNEFFDGDTENIGIIVQGGLYNTVNRALELLGNSDVFGNTRIPMYVMNVTYPVIDEEVLEFCRDKDAVLLFEEGQPDYIEQNLHSILRKAGVETKLHGKDLLPMGGEYTTQVVTQGLTKFLEQHAPELLETRPALLLPPDNPASPFAPRVDAKQVQARPPGLCTGCPERPIFSAMKLAEKETGQEHHISMDIGCHLFGINEPFNLGGTTMGYGLGSAGAAALNSRDADRSTIGVMGDGGFWHNGLTSGIGNAVFNKNDQVVVVVDNSYAAATGGQDLLSSYGQAETGSRSSRNPIERAVRGVGVKWAKTMTHTYDVAKLKKIFVEAFTTKTEGPKVIVAQSECQLNRQRRVKPQAQQDIAAGKRVVRQRFGVDAETCTGDHACIRISGCPSLTLKENPDPMRTDPVATVTDTCVGCGVCGANAHAAALCPSFYRTDVVINPSWRDRALGRVRSAWISLLSNPVERRASQYEVAA
ncbi:indolepyruvate ferredoxin oxidoreductase alpha subunit [Leucobacter luti]|uniref:Indolepyruvate ferredoxin oxidoreductase alpha subunit n=1 Tax=Leucobacter luti TaxID=340320 RepID=A0A4Q7U0A3_9MICO|nr:indolepyruvate ferredoxin oxidoreductase subunit alpha [Leucobacter luti]MBL3698783.1 indolepyruvate ferredoxin oxidoreductase subunit alpha [Leucobacter luti]RZT66160.1 indolepyruvate ferredoxin oxidoreductase alpha subunit [Leucobacter luti]